MRNNRLQGPARCLTTLRERRMGRYCADEIVFGEGRTGDAETGVSSACHDAAGAWQRSQGVAVTGAEIAVGYVFAWLVAKARRAAGRADAEVDRGLDAGMDRLHDLVSRKLGQDPALQRAREEAEAGQTEPSDRTQRRLTDALEDAGERDAAFAEALENLVKELQDSAGPGRGGVSASRDGQAIGGNVDIRAEGGSAAALKMGDVTIGSAGNPRQPGPDQG
ncbi:hypothetical protein [Streptomyces sp. NPDC007205]|uniref:hypothetical protein n=1 Tax=Streptomyces sp. NPDC007205 TaxID=3154316 RepID=UPI0033CF3308